MIMMKTTTMMMVMMVVMTVMILLVKVKVMMMIQVVLMIGMTAVVVMILHVDDGEVADFTRRPAVYIPQRFNPDCYDATFISSSPASKPEG